MKWMVLGANSFSGASFVDYLLSKEQEVWAVSRTEKHEAFLPYQNWHKRNYSNFYRLTGIDINNNITYLEDVIRKQRPTHIVNFIAQSMVGESWEHPEHWMQTNVVATTKLHEILRRCDFLQKYVYATTPEVYGPMTESEDGWVKEDHSFNPSTPYAVSRAAADMLLMAYFRQYNFPVVLTRAANVYGPGQQLFRIVPKAILSVMFGRKLKLDGGGVSKRSFVHIQDVCEATYRLALDAVPGNTFHISSQRLLSIRDLVEKIFSMVGKSSFDYWVDIGPERPGKDLFYALDSNRLRKAFGWSDKIGLEDGIQGVIDWVCKYKDVLAKMPTDYEHMPGNRP